MSIPLSSPPSTPNRWSSTYSSRWESGSHPSCFCGLGGFSHQRPELDHHSQMFVEMVQREVGSPGAVVVDKDVGESHWSIPPYADTGHSLEGWKAPGIVRLIRREGHVGDAPAGSTRLG